VDAGKRGEERYNVFLTVYLVYVVRSLRVRVKMVLKIQGSSIRWAGEHRLGRVELPDEDVLPSVVIQYEQVARVEDL